MCNNIQSENQIREKLKVARFSRAPRKDLIKGKVPLSTNWDGPLKKQIFSQLFCHFVTWRDWVSHQLFIESWCFSFENTQFLYTRWKLRKPSCLFVEKKMISNPREKMEIPWIYWVEPATRERLSKAQRAAWAAQISILHHRVWWFYSLN